MAVLAELRSKGMKTTNVCLHVGAGTFKPVSAETAAEHEMHEEKFSVPRKAVRDLLVSKCLGEKKVMQSDRRGGIFAFIVV